ncbi:N-acetylmuramoyl-L-alanine amidase [Corynebacterium sp. A21]|uniref:N-acetylmuramoyl-L-alanine amidase n=1 Tax=Corynebacterium sp. A21 TaxID=3457318 RepID=UPI003FCF435C
MQQRRRLTAVRQRPTLAIIMSIVIVAAVVVGLNTDDILKTQEAGTAPVSASEESVSLTEGENIVVEDAAISAQGGEAAPSAGGTARTVKEFTRDQEFSMFALTWQGHRDIAPFVRAEAADGSWGPWYAAEPMDAVSPTGMSGTDLVYIEPTTKVQVSVTGVDIIGTETGEAPAEEAAAEQAPAEAPVAEAPAEEAPAEEAPVVEAPAPVVEAPVEQAPAPAAEAPVGAGTAPLPTNYGDIKPVADVSDAADIQAVFIDGNEEEGGIALAAESDSYGMPNVISRAGWRADESLRCSSPTYDDSVSAITIHHTAGSNNYTEAGSAAQMRGYYKYHASTLGWCDIGYQSLVDKYGNIFEGRAGGLNKAVQGAHAGGFNQNTWAISMMGDYSNVTPSAATIQAVGELAGWRASVADAQFDPTGSDVHYSEGTSYAKYPYGAAVTLPNIFAHRDVGNTACPGNAGYAQMGNIRSIAKTTYDGIQNGTGGNGGGSIPDDNTTPPITDPIPDEPIVTPPVDNEPGTAQLSSVSGLDIEGLINGDQSAIIAAAGTIAVVALSLALSQGDVGGIGNLGDVEVVSGLTLGHIPPVLQGVVSLSGDSEIGQLAQTLLTVLGPVLGESRSGVQYAGDRNGNSGINYALFDNGIILDSDQTGAHALWGAIGDAWASQGYDLGPLGLPTSEEYQSGNLTRVDFQNGYITYDPATNAVDIQQN